MTVRLVPQRVPTALGLLGPHRATKAVALGVPSDLVRQWQTGRALPDPEGVARLAATAGLPVSWFYEDGPSDAELVAADGERRLQLWDALSPARRRAARAWRTRSPWRHEEIRRGRRVRLVGAVAGLGVTSFMEWHVPGAVFAVLAFAAHVPGWREEAAEDFNAALPVPLPRWSPHERATRREVALDCRAHKATARWGPAAPTTSTTTIYVPERTTP